MADTRAAWGIEIGQAGLKAIRLEYSEAADQVVATAFDFVAHPKILSQPDANPEALIHEALDTFLTRNNVEGDLISISVPGQTALARFIQLPPVESSKVAEIVKYEARQQIPFALEDVIWDYQPLGSGTEEGGFMLDAEVGLFAMKRDQVQQTLQPFLDQLVEVESIQISPLALYNFLCYDQMDLGKDDPVDPDADYTIVLDMGADNTTLLVTNGQKIWLRNVPIGGNHFTRALTKDLKLTFAKAEHLKCNATKSPDPRSVFQALRPVFNDYVSEIRRSIGYFSSVNKEAKIEKVVGVGNGFKLAGLQKFLQQNLQYQVDRVHSFDAVSGDAVLRAPLFQDNIMSFAVPYGLALQSLGLTRIHTSLLPPEITTERLIRKKKPWAIAAAASLLVGFTLSAIGYTSVMASVEKDIWSSAEDQAKQVQQQANGFKSNYAAATSANATLRQTGDTLVGVEEDRIYWPELYKAINECLPREVGDEGIESDDPSKKKRIQINSIRVRFIDELTEWYVELTDAQKAEMREDDQRLAPKGPGYLVMLSCQHSYKEDDPRFTNRKWIRETILENLKQWTVQQDKVLAEIPVRKIGITHPVLAFASKEQRLPDLIPKSGQIIDNRMAKNDRGRTRGGSNFGADDDLFQDRGKSRRGGGGRGSIARPTVSADSLPTLNTTMTEPEYWEVPLTQFQIQFVWQPTPFKLRKDVDPALAESAGDAQAGEEGSAVQPSGTDETNGTNDTSPTPSEPAADATPASPAGDETN